MDSCVFTEHRIVVEGETFVSKVWSTAFAERTIVILPPGGLNIDQDNLLGEGTYNEAIRDIIKTSNIVIFDYPGIGSAPRAHHASVQDLALRCLAIIKDLDFHDVIAFGVSFGGSVVNEMIDKKPEIFKKAVIIASGEYLFFPTKQIFQAITFINIFIPSTSVLIKYILVDVLKFFNPFDLNDTHSLVIMGRSIFRYKIGKKKHHLPTQLVFLDKDTVVRPKSITKMIAKYPNHSILHLNVRHTKKLMEPEKKEIEKVVFQSIIPFLKSSIG